MARVLGLDVGTKTIGVAVSDPGRVLASPVRTLSRRSVQQDVAALLHLAAELAAGEAILGLPYELDGSEGRSARLARQIGGGLAAGGLLVRYVDERFTSVEAERRLIEAGMSRARRREVIDQQAAVGILQSWLDHPELEEHG